MPREGKYLHNIFCPALTSDAVPQMLSTLKNAAEIRQRYEYRRSVPTSETIFVPSTYEELPTCQMHNRNGVYVLQITLLRQSDGSITQWEIHDGWFCWANESNLLTLIVMDEERILHFRIVPQK